MDLIKDVEKSDHTLTKLINGEKSEEVQKNELIVFIEDIKDILEFNGDKIGNFSKGQIANIPKEIAKILIEDGKAELV